MTDEALMTLRRIANARTITPNGKPRHLRTHEMINMARDACDRVGVPYDGRSVGIVPAQEPDRG
jgi:hypothetical protein